MLTPLSYIGENMTTANLKGRFQINGISFETNVSALSYNLDNGSTNIWINPLLNNALNTRIIDSLAVDSLRNVIDQSFFSNLRFMGAKSDEWSIEQTVSGPIWKTGNLTIGAKYLRGTGEGWQEYQNRVVNLDNGNSSNLSPAFSDLDIEEFSLFLQLFQPIGQYFNLLLGSQYLERENGDFAPRINTFNPRVALLYKPADQLQLRASYSTAIRAPAPYFGATTYTYEPGNFTELTTGAVNLEPERTQASELGLNWRLSDQVDMNISASYSITRGFINYNIEFSEFGPIRRQSGFTLGYFNDEDSKAELFDIQTIIRFKELVPSIKLGGIFHMNISSGKETLTTTSISAFRNDVQELDGLRAYPSFMSRWSLWARPWEPFQINIDQYYVSRSLTRNSFRLNDNRNRPNDVPSEYIDGYYSIDLTLNYQVNRNFLLYLKGINILDANYGGIDASSSSDILLVNPQSARLIHLGLNYEFN